MLSLFHISTMLVLLAPPASTAVQITLEIDKNGKPVSIVIAGLDEQTLAACARRPLESPDWERGATVRTVAGTEEHTNKRSAMLGTWRVKEERLVFKPRFSFTTGITLRVAIDSQRLLDPKTKPGMPMVRDLVLPRIDMTPVTKIVQIYPTRDDLPENQLRFYIEFSAPMSRGEAYDHIRILNEKGIAIDDAFLELGEELWNPAGTRFTLLFDPGRVKSGLKPREDLGPVLEAGKKYTLVIKGNWKDAEDRPLVQKEYRKSFRAGPADNAPPDPKKWKLIAPPADTTQPFQLHFNKSMDHALLERVLWIVDDKSEKVKGTISVGESETVWKFTPDQRWVAGKYRLVVETILEDLAANRIGKPFEVDVFDPIAKMNEMKTIELPFEVKSRPVEPPQ